MFEVFTALTKRNEKIELCVSNTKDCAAVVIILENDNSVKAFKMSSLSPVEIGMAKNEAFAKFRQTGFTQQDYKEV